MTIYVLTLDLTTKSEIGPIKNYHTFLRSAVSGEMIQKEKIIGNMLHFDA